MHVGIPEPTSGMIHESALRGPGLSRPQQPAALIGSEPTELPVLEPQDDGTWNATIDGVCELGNFSTRALALQAVKDFFDQRDVAREHIWGEPRE